MAIINKAAFAKALWPGVNKWYGDAYASHPEYCTQMFDKYTSEKAFEEDVGTSAFGLAPVKPEGEAISFDTAQQGFITRYQHVTYGLGFIVTEEAIEDDQYMVIANKKAQALAFSMRTTKEVVAANVYNNAFNAAFPIGDGAAMISLAHPSINGPDFANRPTTDADLSEAALEQATIDIMRWKNDRGLNIVVLPQALIVPPEYAFEAERILKSPLQNDTSNNAINALRAKGMYSTVLVNPYLNAGSGAWFIRTNAPDGMKHFERKADSFSDDNDFDTDNLKYKAVARYSFGCTDPRGIYGSPGV